MHKFTPPNTAPLATPPALTVRFAKQIGSVANARRWALLLTANSDIILIKCIRLRIAGLISLAII